jgi:hypothetical protein
LTLIEVLAATVLLSLVLVGVVLARGRATQQWASANHVLDAAEAADAWLTKHWADLESFPRDGQGDLGEDTGLRWRTQTVPNPSVESLGGTCVRLEIFRPDPIRENEPVLAVELVLPGETAEHQSMAKAPMGDAP